MQHSIKQIYVNNKKTVTSILTSSDRWIYFKNEWEEKWKTACR